MLKLHRDVLTRNRVALVKQLIPEETLDHLREENIFTDTMSERVKAFSTRSEQNRALLDDLPRRGPNAYPAFLRALEATKQDHICKTLKSFEDELVLSAKSNKKFSEGNPPPSVTVKPIPSSYRKANATLNYSTPVQATDENSHYSPYQPSPSVHNQQPVHQTTTRQVPSTRKQPCYAVRDNPGRLIIICNKTFPNNAELSQRLGAETDIDKMRETFLKIGFSNVDIVAHRDLYADQISVEVTKFVTDPRTERASSVICMVSSHGEENSIYGSDGNQIREEDIIRLFDRDHAPSIIQKPKLFLFQACRGGGRDIVQHDGPSNVADSSTPSTAGLQVSDASRVHRLSDMVFANATVSGEVAMRNTLTGSWFIQAFCDVLLQHYRSDHMMDMLTLVTHKVTQLGDSHIQLPSPTTHLSKFWYLTK